MGRVIDALVSWLMSSVRISIADLVAGAETVDADGDGYVSLGELIAYIRRPE